MAADGKAGAAGDIDSEVSIWPNSKVSKMAQGPDAIEGHEGLLGAVSPFLLPPGVGQEGA